MLRNKPRGIPRVDDVASAYSGSCDRVSRGAIRRKAAARTPLATITSFAGGAPGVWDRIIEALRASHDAAVQMIDTSVVRVHQRGACLAGNEQQDMGRSRGGLTSMIHAVVDADGLPVRPAGSFIQLRAWNAKQMAR